LKTLDIVPKLWAPLGNSSPLLVSQAGYGPASMPLLAALLAMIVFSLIYRKTEVEQIN